MTDTDKTTPKTAIKAFTDNTRNAYVIAMGGTQALIKNFLDLTGAKAGERMIDMAFANFELITGQDGRLTLDDVVATDRMAFAQLMIALGSVHQSGQVNRELENHSDWIGLATENAKELEALCEIAKWDDENEYRQLAASSMIDQIKKSLAAMDDSIPVRTVELTVVMSSVIAVYSAFHDAMILINRMQEKSEEAIDDGTKSTDENVTADETSKETVNEPVTAGNTAN